MTIFTIGHSNQAIEPFVAALAARSMRLVIDVRRFPSSRRHPHFSKARLEPALAARGIDYLHMPELGGRLEPRADSANTALPPGPFRGYADYMETPAFSAAIAHLIEEATRRRAAILCAERRWTECHRMLIADWLHVQGHEVIHILSGDTCERHALSPGARVVDERLSYRGLL